MIHTKPMSKWEEIAQILLASEGSLDLAKLKKKISILIKAIILILKNTLTFKI